MVLFWGDESVVDAPKKLIPFLFRSFCNRLIFKLKKIGGTKTGSQLATLFVTFSSAQALAVHIKNHGLVILAGCSHAGIINIVRHVCKITGTDKIHAVMGGFHLPGPDNNK